MFSLIFSFDVGAQKSEPKIVKIGYSGYGSNRGIYSDEKAPPLAQYNQEYLDKIAEINNWEFIYVEDSPEQCLEKLESGGIDLLGPMQYTQERGEKFGFTDLSFGYDYSALYCKATDDRYYYEDFAHFDRMKVGLMQSNANNAAFMDYCDENDFSPEIRYYKSNSELVEAIETDEVDAIVTGQFVGSDIVKTIGTFAFVEYYYATGKDNSDILSELNFALEKLLFDDPGFTSRLQEKYFGAGNLAYDMRYTRDEINYMAKNPILSYSSIDSWRSISALVGDTGTYSGIAIDLLLAAQEHLNVRLRPVITQNPADAADLLASNKLSFAIFNGNTYDKTRLTATDPLFQVELVLVGKNATALPDGARIALPFTGSFAGLNDIVQSKYTIVDCVDLSACLEAVKNDEADATLVDPYTLDYINKENDFGNMYVVEILEATIPITLCVKNDADPALLSLLNKAIAKLDAKTINGITMKNTVEMSYKLSFARVVREYAPVFLIGIAVILAAIGAIFITHRHKTNRHVSSVAYTDSLLGIRNFEKFKLDSHTLFTRYKREGFSIIYFDVNQFKYINDNFGYKMGNDILCYITECASKLLYEYELFARVSADNFVMLLKNTDEKQIKQTINKLSRAVQTQPDMVEAGHQITMCFGIYRLPSHKEDFYTTLDRANCARKESKGSHETTYTFYDDKMLRKMAYEVKLREAMQPALENGEFKLFLQPKHDVKTGRISGAEALVRWNSPSMGMIQPGSFIPLMEKNRFVVKIDFFIFECVCKMLRDMLDKGIEIMPVSVNLSRVHMDSRNFIHTLNDIIQRYRIDPAIIELELTESMILQNQHEVLVIMHALKELGFSLSLDDFGTGYSSLNLLMEMPVSVLKLDKSFLNEVIDMQREKTIIRDIVSMAHHLDMTVVCEGVETAEQFDLLKSIDCDIAQGYLFSKPIPMVDYYAYLEAKL